MSLAEFQNALQGQLEQAIDLAKHEAAQEFAAERHQWEQERLSLKRLIEDSNRLLAEARIIATAAESDLCTLIAAIKNVLREHE